MSVKLPNLDCRSRCGIHPLDTGKRDIFLEDWRANAAGYSSDLRPSDMHAITVPHMLI
jgi:hypothetical protein